VGSQSLYNKQRRNGNDGSSSEAMKKKQEKLFIHFQQTDTLLPFMPIALYCAKQKLFKQPREYSSANNTTPPLNINLFSWKNCYL